MLGKGGAASIRTRTQAHRDAIDQFGVGLYYGSRWCMAANPVEMNAYLRTKLLDNAKLPDVRATDCIEWGLEHVGAAYRSAGKAERWQEIHKEVSSTGKKATDLARLLQEDGWEGVYFNPDVANPFAGPTDNGTEHLATARTAAKKGTYYGLKVHHHVLNYRPTADAAQPTSRDMTGLELLKEIPFFFGLARGGKHAFVGSYGEISEVHWDGQPVNRHLMSEVPLEKFDWLSGLLLVPPKSWPRSNA